MRLLSSHSSFSQHRSLGPSGYVMVKMVTQHQDPLECRKVDAARSSFCLPVNLLATFTSLAAICRRRNTVSLLEFMAEMAFIQKANPVHDLLDAEKRGAQ